MIHHPVEDFEAWTALRMVQAPTFADFTIDSDTAFAAVDKLDLCFSMYVPLSSEITAWDIDTDRDQQDPTEEADGETRATITRETDDGIRYETDDSKEVCKWMLFPKCRCHSAGGFCGFRPSFAGFAQRCCHHLHA